MHLPTADEPGATPGAAFLDQNGDYQVNGTGDLVKTTPTMQRATILLRTALDSIGFDPKLGLDVPRAIDATWERRVRIAIETALLPMTSDGSIRIDRIDIERSLAFRAHVTVTYTVLATGEEEIASI